MLEYLFNKVAGLHDCNFIKKSSTQVLSYEYCEILRKPTLKNICERQLLLMLTLIMLSLTSSITDFLISSNPILISENLVFIVFQHFERRTKFEFENR